MAKVDFSSYGNAAPKQQEPEPVKQTPTMVNVVVQVDADCQMYCDGELVNIPLNAGMVSKTQIAPGNHFLQFISRNNPNLKVEKEINIPVTDQNFILRINEFSAMMAPAMPQQPQMHMPPQNGYLDQLTQMAQMNPLASMSVPPMPQMPPMSGTGLQAPPMPSAIPPMPGNPSQSNNQ